MLEKYAGDVLLGAARSADSAPLGSGVRHATFHPCSDDGQFQFGKYRDHLDERLTYGVDFAAAAIHRDAAHNHQPQALLPDGVDDFAQLLRAAAQAACFERDDAVALARRVQQHLKLLFDSRVAVLVLKDNFLAPATFNSLICRRMSCLLSLVEHLAYPYIMSASPVKGRVKKGFYMADTPQSLKICMAAK